MSAAAPAPLFSEKSSVLSTEVWFLSVMSVPRAGIAGLARGLERALRGGCGLGRLGSKSSVSLRLWMACVLVILFRFLLFLCASSFTASSSSLFCSISLKSFIFFVSNAFFSLLFHSTCLSFNLTFSSFSTVVENCRSNS
uniref:Uncharacterized protein n=1 Tax=Cacopsylla melanoneura TaxID=428564 RepID=A0A8D9DWU5_9HEMI